MVDDLFNVNIVPEVAEVMDERDIRAQECVERARDCRKRVDSAYFELAEVLYPIHQEALYVRLGFENFNEFVDKELDFAPRKAAYFISMWDYFGVKMKDFPDLMEKMKSIGWSKAKELVGVVKPSNVDDWTEVAKSNPTSRLHDIVRGAKEKLEADPDADVSPGEIEEKTEKFNTKSFKLTEEQLHNIDLALKKAEEFAESDKPGHLLDQICVNFLSLNMGVDGAEGLAYLLRSVEANFGVQVVAVKRGTESIVYGSDDLLAAAENEGFTPVDDSMLDYSDGEDEAEY